MSINLSQHKNDLLKAFNAVVDTKNETNWGMFCYEGNSNTLKVFDSGDGGLEEMASNFNSGKIMYAVCQITEPTTGLPKLMLIHWQGEGVQPSRLGACASHVSEVQRFFKGVHLTLFARNEDDVEPDVLMKNLKKVSYGAKVIPTSDLPQQPAKVGSVYERVNPSRDINTSERDKFWSQAEKEETTRLEDEKTKHTIEKQAVEDEKRRLQERLTDECQKEVGGIRKSVVGSEVLRKERLQEVQDVIKPQSGLVALWEQKTSAPAEQLTSPVTPTKTVQKKAWPPMPDRRSFDESPSEEQQLLKSPVSSPARKSPLPTIEDKGPWPVHHEPHEEVSRNGNHKEEHDTYTNGKENGRAKEVEYSPSTPVETAQSAPFKMVLPRRQPDSDNEDEQQDWDAPTLEEPAGITTAAPLSPKRLTADFELKQKVNLGVQAQALWDYQAGDDTEIGFDPGDIISHIEFIDEGWWRGRDPNGKFGLFPANYVELIEQ